VLTIEVRGLGSGDEGRWDDFVRSHPAATAYHLTAWQKVLERSFPVRTSYLCATRGSEMIGVLPLVRQKSLVFGHRLTSLPFCTYGGVLAADRESEHALLRQAATLAATDGAEYLELREAREGRDLEAIAIDQGGWRACTRKVTLLLPLDRPVERLLQQVDKTRRYDIRMGQKHGLKFEWGGAERVDAFYSVFAESMRDLGTPVYPRAFFVSMLEFLGDIFRFAFVSLADLPVAAALVARWGGVLEVPLLGTLKRYRALAPTAYLYWNLIAYGAQHGDRVFDFGRCTPGSGTHRYKRKFGGYEQPLPWLYWLPPRGQLPRLAKEEARFGPLIRIWRRLPLWVANRLGPPVSSRLY
jgi:FemAB-related protein (PEP-CTERM system-associated)